MFRLKIAPVTIKESVKNSSNLVKLNLAYNVMKESLTTILHNRTPILLKFNIYNVKLPQLLLSFTSFDYNFILKLLYREILLFRLQISRPGKTSENNLFPKKDGFRVGQNKVAVITCRGRFPLEKTLEVSVFPP